MANDREPLKERARRLREARGLTQKDLAEMAGVSPTHVYQIEAGLRKRMHLDTLDRYAVALEVTPQYLDVGYDSPPAEGSFPDVAVTLRHTTALNEEQIDQVVSFVSALEAAQKLARLEHAGEGNDSEDIVSVRHRSKRRHVS